MADPTVTKRDREAVWSAINRCRCALCRNARDVAWIETGASPTSDMAERIALAIATARAEGAAEERERCAKLCEDDADGNDAIAVSLFATSELAAGYRQHAAHTLRAIAGSIRGAR